MTPRSAGAATGRAVFRAADSSVDGRRRALAYPRRMPRSVRRLPRRRLALVAALSAIALCAAVLGLWRPWTPATPIAAGPGEPVVAVEPAPLALPEHPRVLVFGDSWTYGSAAASPTLGYAYVLSELLGAETIVDGVRGSGYLRPGWDGPDFGTRIAALDPAIDPDLVIVQGSINDRLLIDEDYPHAVDAAWDRLQVLFPRARIVVLGPAPHALPIAKGTIRIDHALDRLAAERGWHYLSPIAEDWITEANYAQVIDTGAGRLHPTTAGHRYLAERVVESLRALAADEAAR